MTTGIAEPPPSKIKMIIMKIVMAGATVFIMLAAVVLIIVFYFAKLFHKLNFKDPFHNSRQHPLNSPEAPRG